MLSPLTEQPPTFEDLRLMNEQVLKATSMLANGEQIEQPTITEATNNANILWKHTKGVPDESIRFAVALGNYEFYQPNEISLVPNQELANGLRTLQESTLRVLTRRRSDVPGTDYLNLPRSEITIGLERDMAEHNLRVANISLSQLIERVTPVQIESA